MFSLPVYMTVTVIQLFQAKSESGRENSTLCAIFCFTSSSSLVSVFSFSFHFLSEQSVFCPPPPKLLDSYVGISLFHHLFIFVFEYLRVKAHCSYEYCPQNNCYERSLCPCPERIFLNIIWSNTLPSSFETLGLEVVIALHHLVDFVGEFLHGIVCLFMFVCL